MNLGIGLYHYMLNRENYNFAKQCGCTHVVVHLVDYFNAGKIVQEKGQPIGDHSGWGMAGNSDQLWTKDALINLKKEINNAGLELEAIENFDPSHWYDVLLDGPKKNEQIEFLKQIIRNVGQADVPIVGYNFSLAGVCSRTTGKFARGSALSVGMNSIDTRPVPNGMVWNMIYDVHANRGYLPKISHDELWERLSFFLNELLPVAEEAGVKLAAHPDDPPMAYVRQTPRLVYQPRLYQKLLDIKSSESNSLEFCLGSIAEMTEGNVYDATEQYADHIAYVHFRNIIGKVPRYKEVFVDEGDIDIVRILRILKSKHFNGVLIPDHTPAMSCGSSWHAGMAYTLGYMKAALLFINKTG